MNATWVTIFSKGSFANDQWSVKEPGYVRGSAVIIVDIIKQHYAILGMETTDCPDKYRLFLGQKFKEFATEAALAGIVNEINVALGSSNTKIVVGAH